MCPDLRLALAGREGKLLADGCRKTRYGYRSGQRLLPQNLAAYFGRDFLRPLTVQVWVLAFCVLLGSLKSLLAQRRAYEAAALQRHLRAAS